MRSFLKSVFVLFFEEYFIVCFEKYDDGGAHLKIDCYLFFRKCFLEFEKRQEFPKSLPNTALYILLFLCCSLLLCS